MKKAKRAKRSRDIKKKLNKRRNNSKFNKRLESIRQFNIRNSNKHPSLLTRREDGESVDRSPQDAGLRDEQTSIEPTAHRIPEATDSESQGSIQSETDSRAEATT